MGRGVPNAMSIAARTGVTGSRCPTAQDGDGKSSLGAMHERSKEQDHCRQHQTRDGTANSLVVPVDLDHDKASVTGGEEEDREAGDIHIRVLNRARQEMAGAAAKAAAACFETAAAVGDKPSLTRLIADGGVRCMRVRLHSIVADV